MSDATSASTQGLCPWKPHPRRCPPLQAQPGPLLPAPTPARGCMARGWLVLLCCSSPEPPQDAERREWEHKLLHFTHSLCWTRRVRGRSWDTESNFFLFVFFLFSFLFSSFFSFFSPSLSFSFLAWTAQAEETKHRTLRAVGIQPRLK